MLLVVVLVEVAGVLRLKYWVIIVLELEGFDDEDSNLFERGFNETIDEVIVRYQTDFSINFEFWFVFDFLSLSVEPVAA